MFPDWRKRQGDLQPPFRILGRDRGGFQKAHVPDRREAELAPIEMEVADGVGRLLACLRVEVPGGDIHHLVPVPRRLRIVIELGCLGFVPQPIGFQGGCRQSCQQAVSLPGNESRPPVGRADRGVIGIGQHEFEPLERLFRMAGGDQLLGVLELFRLGRVVGHPSVDHVAGPAAITGSRGVLSLRFRTRIRIAAVSQTDCANDSREDWEPGSRRDGRISRPRAFRRAGTRWTGVCSAVPGTLSRNKNNATSTIGRNRSMARTGRIGQLSPETLPGKTGLIATIPSVPSIPLTEDMDIRQGRFSGGRGRSRTRRTG